MDVQPTPRRLLPRWAPTVILIGSAIALGGTATPPGAKAVAALQGFLAIYAGVFALVGLSLTVMVGLLATERTMLGIRHRVLAQALHRAMSSAAIAFLVAHIFVGVLAHRVRAVDAVAARFTPVGLGALAFDLMLVVMLTGLGRGRFAAVRHPGTWRVLHAIAYACWPIAIVHGLTAGRSAAGWVVWGYLLSLAAVGLAVLTRLALGMRSGGQLRADTERDERERIPIPEPATAERQDSGIEPGAAERNAEREHANRAFWETSR